MPEHICFLITILYGVRLLDCALSVNKSKLVGDCDEFPMEPENREQLYNLLPRHVKSCGPIVAVRQIFEIVQIPDRKEADDG